MAEGGPVNETRTVGASPEDNGAPWLWVAVALGLLGVTLWYFSWGPHPSPRVSPSPGASGHPRVLRPTPTVVLPTASEGAGEASPDATGNAREGVPDAGDETPPGDDAVMASPGLGASPSVDESGFPPAASPSPLNP